MTACLSRVPCGFQIAARQCYLFGTQQRWHEARHPGAEPGSPPTHGLSARETRGAVPADPVPDSLRSIRATGGGLPPKSGLDVRVPGEDE
jgi:hypothetical protein